MKPSAEGILYPRNAKSTLHFPDSAVGRLSSYDFEIPHAAWSKCKPELDAVFGKVAGQKPSLVFVLGPLHNGPVIGSSNTVYAPSDGKLSGSDWEINLSVPEALEHLVTVSDDICSEEHSLEIAAPYLSLLFPDVPVCYLLASGRCDSVRIISFLINEDFPNALVFISNNRETCCAGMWKEAFS